MNILILIIALLSISCTKSEPTHYDHEAWQQSRFQEMSNQLYKMEQEQSLRQIDPQFGKYYPQY